MGRKLKKKKKEDMCIYIADSLFYAAEMNTTLKSNYIKKLIIKYTAYGIEEKESKAGVNSYQVVLHIRHKQDFIIIFKIKF